MACYLAEVTSAPKRIRIAVAGVKGRCPRPLDDGGTGMSIAEIELAYNGVESLTPLLLSVLQ